MTALRSGRPGEHDESTSVIAAADPAEWDALVARAPDASFCHLWRWREIIEDVAGHECLYVVAHDADGATTGVLPLVHVRNRLFGSHLVSIPFLNYGGPAGTTGSRARLARWAIEEAGRRNATSVLLRTRYPVASDLPVESSKVTVVLPLPRSSDEMWNTTFNAKFRNKIKRPQRDGMVTHFGAEHLGGFYDVWAENMRDLGTPVLPRAFFERIATAFPELVTLGVTYWNGAPVAGGMGFRWRDEFEMTWSSSARALRAQKPNMLLYWDFMRELIAKGVTAFNFGRSTPGTGPHEFKQSWGGVDEPLPWIRWPATTGGGDRDAASVASRVWRHLPLTVTNALGPALARRLPWW